ncbi:TetR family transcriptional regulator [Williamsia sp. MIQD14]|uniref:TetR family transcriptional regulator n=1 Tax=Williamsia sp. MIQD14 TaxID=3425703 RepID=UPI003DA0DA23
MREQVLATAHVLTVEKGWDRVRVAEIAALVGVSRPTLYKEFGDKQGLGDALVVREGERFLTGIRHVLDEHSGHASEAVTSAVRFTLDEAAASPLLKAVLTSSTADDTAETDRSTGMLPLLTTSTTLLQIASNELVCWFTDRFPQLDNEDVADGIDALVRLTVSHLVLPAGDSDTTGRQISRVALRYLGLDEPLTSVDV